MTHRHALGSCRFQHENKRDQDCERDRENQEAVNICQHAGLLLQEAVDDVMGLLIRTDAAVVGKIV